MKDINRRQFITGTGAAGLMATFPSIARALAIPATVKSGTINDIEHVVILMQENRSFDHYFGTLSGVRGFSDPYPAPAAAAKKAKTRNVFTQFNGKEEEPHWVKPFPLNTRQTFPHMRVEGTPHSWPDSQEAWDHGRMNKWPEAKHLHSMGYFERNDMPFQYALAESFTLCDAYHCSIQAGTNSNRLFLWSATNDGRAKSGGPCIGNSHDNLPENGGAPAPYTWTTYVERLQKAGISWTIYQDMADNFTDNPLVGFAAFQNSIAGNLGSDPELATKGLTTRTLDKLRQDVQNDMLPSVSYIIATAEGSEHPGPSSPVQGAAYTAEVLDALTSNPEVWSKTALFIMFDENDGFFDHMPPPAPPSPLDKTNQAFAGHSQISTEGEYHLHMSKSDAELERKAYMGNPYGLGARVPAYVISPWSRGGHVSSEVLDHTSVIRFLEQRFGVMEPNISPWRRAVCGDFLNAFDFTNPNKSPLPKFPNISNDAILAAMLPERTTPPIPSPQNMPKQEIGIRKYRPCLYALNVNHHLSKDGQSLAVQFNNEGQRAGVFHVYNHLALGAIPRRYTIEKYSDYIDNWLLKDGRYDLQVMGPEGFHRRIKGQVNESNKIEDVSLIVEKRECYLLAKSVKLSFKLNTPNAEINTLPVNKRVNIPVDDNQRYDVSVFNTKSSVFLRQFAGRIPA
jgi:phospholipase C